MSKATFKCDFYKCYAGVRMEGVQDAAITRSTFLVGEPQQGDWENTPYGVYSDQCTGYEIEENSFVAVNSANMAMVGLVIKDSGPNSNKFYNNTFDGFDVDNSTGSLIEGVNADANANYMVFAADLLTVPNNAWLLIRDVLGRELDRLPLRQQQGQLIWDACHAPPGSYTVTLFNNGAQLKSEKFVLRP